MSSEFPDDMPRRKPAQIKAEINVTPLVDVVLVLLIIFMVVTPQMEAGMNVNLPSIFNPDDGKNAVEPTTLTLTSEGHLFLEKDLVTEDALVTRLEKLHSDKPEARLVLKADRSLGYGKVRTLFKTCQTIGFPGVALQVIDRANQAKGTVPNGV